MCITLLDDSTRSRQGEERDPEVELEHQQCLAAFSRVKFTRVLLTVLIAFTKKETTFLVDNKKVFGTHLMQDMVKDALRSFVSPPVLSPNLMLMRCILSCRCCLYNNHQAKDCIDSFVTHCVRIHGHNRARQRDKLGHILEEFATLQDEYLLSGFELELYSMHEYYYIYWYLSEFLYAWLMSTLSRADGSQMAEERIMEEQQKGRSSKKTKKKKKGATMVAFDMDGKVRKPKFELDSEQVRYEHRFAPFNSVMTPPPVHYLQFKEMSDLNKYSPPPQSPELYVAASKHFQQAKMILENIPNPDREVSRILKVAKPNFVVMKLLAGGHKKESKVRVPSPCALLAIDGGIKYVQES
ncbi:hypothetical protein A6R68_13048 [Neotoma lepida]|uniref:N-alpha-acetyltransferase 35, NatC auxiliary subunit n=1 Tax=Neotoma lepida TaxID=56216 RepID=A0A1A6H1Z1_NEOLE|nr:hypothetical protein A6R68_13048 [Neotoma lepida]